MVHEASGLVVNAVVWDGFSPFHIRGCYLMSRDDVPEAVWIGWRRDDNQWISPEPEPFEG